VFAQRDLNLSATAVTDTGMVHLRGLPVLEALHLDTRAVRAREKLPPSPQRPRLQEIFPSVSVVAGAVGAGMGLFFHCC